ncbi:MAG: thioredoxin domain-containing protein [Caldilineales bacterium]|nr:thioredoxin domain-containing protein [Caldilineales bacterium]
MPNHLAQATSPYLLQHADNPVDWYQWGDEAFARARSEDKPIFLSVGYAACHWCHVMAHESFEDPETAAVMNEHFVNIKVDREERPDVDAIYMDAVVAITRHGGWPMSVFLTPDGEPFYGGTYYPKYERYGMPSFRRVLLSIHDAWQNRRDRLQDSAAQLTASLAQSARLRPDPGELSPEMLDAASAQLYQFYDDQEGGFGGAPKFPQAMTLEFLLRQHARTGETAPLAMVEHTLRKMANGGMYDQLGGGFHRYSTDDRWLVPHFEKMLYDNALLARVYLYAWQLTRNPFYRRIVEETLDYVLREMTDLSGGFYSTQDADSEGEEGKFFVWTPQEVREVLDAEDAALFGRYYDVTAAGNWEGKSILHVDGGLEEVALTAGVTPERLDSALRRGRELLFAVRDRRIKPGLDNKVLAAWNGLMMRAMAEAGVALQRSDYLAAAVRNAEFIGREMLDGRGRLYRSWKNGRPTLNGYLEDYTVVAEGLVALYQATLDMRWLREADRLLGIVHKHFWDEESGAAFHTSDDHESLIVRRKDFFDNAEPSGNSAYATAAMRLGRLLDRLDYAERSEVIFRFMRHPMTTQPSGFGHLLCALDFYLRPSREIVIVGDPGDVRTQALRRTAHERWLPNAVLAGFDPSSSAPHDVPLLQGRTLVDGKPAAYVCRNMACHLPVTEADALISQLSEP